MYSWYVPGGIDWTDPPQLTELLLAFISCIQGTWLPEATRHVIGPPCGSTAVIVQVTN